MTTFAQPIYGAPKILQSDGFLSSNYIRKNINQFAVKAGDLANQLLAPKNTPYNGPVVIRNNYYYSTPYYTPWLYSRPSVIVVDNGRGKRGNEQDNGKNILLGVALTAGALFMSFFVGSAYSTYNDATRERENARNAHREVANFQGYASPNDYPILNEARIMTSLQDRICSRIKNSAMWDLALKIGVTAGLVTGAVGAFTCPPMLGLGLVIGTASAGAMLFRWGMESKDKMNLLDAQELRASVINLKQL